MAKNVRIAFIDQNTKKIVGPNVKGEIWCSFLFCSCSNFDSDRCPFSNCNNNKTRRDPKYRNGNKSLLLILHFLLTSLQTLEMVQSNNKKRINTISF